MIEPRKKSKYKRDQADELEVGIPAIDFGSITAPVDNEQMPQLGTIEAQPFRGGCNTVLEPQQIQFGGYSMIQNMRNMHPGFRKRKGQRRLHTVEDGSGGVKSIYQFSKGARDEKHTFAQMADDDVLEATNHPPQITTGAFGSEVFSGSSNSKPASWTNINDMLIFANGVDKHQIYTGSATPVAGFIKYDGSEAPPAIPTIGIDYTENVIDSNDGTVAVLDSINTLANYECVFIRTDVPATGFTFTVSAANGNSSTMTVAYYNGSWTSVSGGSDGTATAGATLAKTGTYSFTRPTDSIQSYMYGLCGYWYRVTFSAQLGSEVEISECTYSSEWQAIENVWDSVAVDAIEAQVFINADSAYSTYPSVAVTVSELTSSDKVYFSSYNMIEGIYVDVGSIPSTTGSVSITIYYWNGSAWATVGSVTDGTNGLTNSGWIKFPRKSDAQQRELNNNLYYAYWYYMVVSDTLSEGVSISIQTMPFFDITEFGLGYSCCAWKNRCVYSFNRDHYIYVSAAEKPQSLNGSDFAILEAGDGRKNRVVAMRKFFSELMVWQEEKGQDGGCLTLFEGYSPQTFGKVLLSNKIGTLNSKSVAIVDASYVSTKTDEVGATVAFWLSHYGVFRCEGTYISRISDPIQNYFDPTQDECIRNGYEDQMWLEYDSAHNVIRIGLVSGTSSTTPNVFPVYDVLDGTWSFDSFEQDISCVAEIEADSGAVPILQIAGGADDGFIYQSNYGLNDVSTAIDAYCTVELNAKGLEVLLREFILRLKKNEGGCTVTPYLDGVAQTAITITD